MGKKVYVTGFSSNNLEQFALNKMYKTKLRNETGREAHILILLLLHVAKNSAVESILLNWKLELFSICLPMTFS